MNLGQDVSVSETILVCLRQNWRGQPDVWHVQTWLSQLCVLQVLQA